jgi:hypothetical protein
VFVRIGVKVYYEDMEPNKEDEKYASDKKTLGEQEKKKIERNESDFGSFLKHMKDAINPCFLSSSNNSYHTPSTNLLEHIPIHLDNFTDIFIIDPALHLMPEDRPIYSSQ